MHNPVFRETGGPTPGNPLFERISQGIIILSLLAMSISTMSSIPSALRIALITFDVIAGIVFAGEYAMRIYFAKDRRAYIFSFWGIIDFIAVIPSLFIAGADLKALRAIRLLRLFRLLKLARTSTALIRLGNAFKDQRYEFAVFGLLSILILYIASVGVYTFEHEAQPDAFPSIPAAMWWAVATLTTVGYGDVYPITAGGRVFTGVVLFVGLGLVAVPTGLIATALQHDPKENKSEDSTS